MANSSVTSSDSPSISSSVLWVMTIATGMIVGNLYYCQPLLSDMQTSLGGSEVVAGWIPTLTQLGYAFGMLLLVPLGDRLERRRLIVVSTFLSGLVMIAMSQAPTLGFAIAMSLLVGLTTVAPQFIIPFAAHLAPEAKRGQVVGTVMSGLLLGILLARTVAGFIGSAYGWRSMFAIAALAMIVLSVLLRYMLPKSEPTFRGSYLELLGSVFHFVRTEPVLRETMIFGSLMFAAFGAFWATLIHLMESEVFNLGAKTVGIFGVFGAAGALMAPIVGKLADRKSPRVISGYGIVVMAISFVVYMLWGGHSLVALAIGVLLMDVGLQATHISNQSRYFALNPAARSCINTAYMFAYFLGGAAGSYLGTLAWAYHGWTGVCAVSLAFIALAGLRYLVGVGKSVKPSA